MTKTGSILPDETLNAILRTGSNHNRTELRLIYNFMSVQTKEEYEELRQHSIEQHTDFALETPFADNFGLNEVMHFKSKQYIIHGIFFGLNTVEQSITNVSIRVKKKGHDLPIQSIEWNFNQCYLNLNQHFDLFDSILFMDAQNPLTDPVLIAQYIQKRIIYIHADRPVWLDRFTSGSR